MPNLSAAETGEELLGAVGVDTATGPSTCHVTSAPPAPVEPDQPEYFPIL
jgi:hypothetical protein